MNKIIGLMTVWGAGPFVEPALKQALEYCDELLVHVGYHHQDMKKFADDTEDICKKYVDLVVIPQHNESYTTWRAKVLNVMLKKSSAKRDDWIYLVDVDEFFIKKDFKKAVSMFDKCDSIQFEEKYFVINMKKHVAKISSPRLWKHNRGKFRPTDKWTKPFNNTLVLPGMFHYSLLCNPFAKIAFWETERQASQPHKSNWITDIYLEYDVGNDKWLAGSYGDSFETNNGNLFLYKENHPEYIEEAGLPNIQDFREIWK